MLYCYRLLAAATNSVLLLAVFVTHFLTQQLAYGAQLELVGAQLDELQTRALLCTDNQRRQATIEALDLSANKLTRVFDWLFANCDSLTQLKALKLNDNRILTVDSHAFDSMPNVEALQLDGNQLRRVPVRALSALPHLRHLSIAENALSNIVLIDCCSNLVSLNVRHNSFDALSENAFKFQSSLQSLALSDAKLTRDKLPKFVGLTALRFYYLDRNLLTELPANFCQHSTSLTSIHLASNLLSSVPDLRDCKSLLLADFSRNKIKSLLSTSLIIINEQQQQLTLPLPESITDLYLSFNEIETLSERALSLLRNLQVLEVDNNKLLAIDARAFSSQLISLRELNLSFNAKLEALPIELTNSSVLRVQLVGNERLRELPVFTRARHLALTYAYHCCRYLQQGGSVSKRRLLLKSNVGRSQKKEGVERKVSNNNDYNYENDDGDENEDEDKNEDENEIEIENENNNNNNNDDEERQIDADNRRLVRRQQQQQQQQQQFTHLNTNGALIDELARHLLAERKSRNYLNNLQQQQQQQQIQASTTQLQQANFSNAMSLSAATFNNANELLVVSGVQAALKAAFGGKRARNARSSVSSAALSSSTKKSPIVCIPKPNAFTPCDNLLDAWWLRLGVWLTFIASFIGNVLVIVVLVSQRVRANQSSALTSIAWLSSSRRAIDVPRFLVINLAIADLLLSIYLGILASVDFKTREQFQLFAISWVNSFTCKVASFLAILGSELSVFILAVITLERSYAITNAVHLNRRLSLPKAILVLLAGYLFALTLALLPLNGFNNYKKFCVCLPLDTTASSKSRAFVALILATNSAGFTLLLACYVRMYCTIRGSHAWTANDMRIAKRMSILVLTDFACWMPIIIIAICSLTGTHLIGARGIKVLTVFVLPLNSVANPFLYAITTKRFKKELDSLTRALTISNKQATSNKLPTQSNINNNNNNNNHHHHHHNNYNYNNNNNNNINQTAKHNLHSFDKPTIVAAVRQFQCNACGHTIEMRATNKQRVHAALYKQQQRMLGVQINTTDSYALISGGCDSLPRVVVAAHDIEVNDINQLDSDYLNATSSNNDNIIDDNYNNDGHDNDDINNVDADESTDRRLESVSLLFVDASLTSTSSVPAPTVDAQNCVRLLACRPPSRATSEAQQRLASYEQAANNVHKAASLKSWSASVGQSVGRLLFTPLARAWSSLHVSRNYDSMENSESLLASNNNQCQSSTNKQTTTTTTTTTNTTSVGTCNITARRKSKSCDTISTVALAAARQQWRRSSHQSEKNSDTSEYSDNASNDDANSQSLLICARCRSWSPAVRDSFSDVAHQSTQASNSLKQAISIDGSQQNSTLVQANNSNSLDKLEAINAVNVNPIAADGRTQTLIAAVDANFWINKQAAIDEYLQVNNDLPPTEIFENQSKQFRNNPLNKHNHQQNKE